MAARTDTDVAVIGAGPVGLCAALALERRGISCTVLEAGNTLPGELRASTFHPPTLEMLEPFGVTGDLLAHGLICPAWQVRLHPSGERAVFDLSVLKNETSHPYRLQCEQSKLVGFLAARLGLAVRFGARAVTVSQDADRAEVALESGERLAARYAIGADGAHSVARKALGIAFPGDAYPETTILVTSAFPFDRHIEGLSNVSYCWKPGGNFTLMRLKDVWRVSVYPPAGSDPDTLATADALLPQMHDIVPGIADFGIGLIRPYRVHQRLAERYGQGRIWLAGDAAHLNSPTGGMGMNGGIHDAFELAAAVAAALGGDAAALARYERRRRPIAEDDILRQAHQNRARMQERDPAARRARLAELQRIAGDGKAAHAFLLRSSMIEGLRRAAALA